MIVHKRKARQDIWLNGRRSPSNNKQGYSLDRSKPRTQTQYPYDHDDTLIVSAGQEYYTWHPKGRDWQYSLEKPIKQKSEWEEKLQEFRDQLSNIEFGSDDDNIDDDNIDEEEKEQSKNTFREDVEEYRDELQSRLDNMPEQLQESSVLNERIEELDSLIEEL